MRYVVQVAHVHLLESAKDQLSARAYERVTEWLKQWTCRANFKATFVESVEAGEQVCCEQLRQGLVPDWMARESGVLPSMFSFNMAVAEVDERGQFWPSMALLYGGDRKVGSGVK